MKCKIELLDEVNCKISGLDVKLRNKLKKQFTYRIPHAIFTPSYKLGRWDGTVTFFTIGGKTFINLLQDIVPVLVEERYEVSIVDNRCPEVVLPTIDADLFAHVQWPEKHQCAGDPIILRDYQVQIINQFLTNPGSIQQAATGSGKTLVIAALSHLVHKRYPIGRTLVIVPSKALVTQTEDDYKNLGMDVGVFFGDRKERGHTHTIATWQSLHAMQERSEEELKEFLNGVIAVICDECHQCKANVLKSLMSGPLSNLPIRWGLTGTIPKEDYNWITLKICIGELVGELPAATLQSRGVLANCHVKVWQMLDYVEFKNWQTELKFLTTDEKRIMHIVAMLDMNVIENGNTLILVDRIKAGQNLVALLPKDRAIFIEGKMKVDERKYHYKDITDRDNKILVSTYGCTAQGIDLPRIFNLVLVEPGKSFVRVMQSIGRGLRKTNDKEFVQIYDICSNAKFSKKHLRERKKYYKESHFQYDIEKIDYRN